MSSLQPALTSAVDNSAQRELNLYLGDFQSRNSRIALDALVYVKNPENDPGSTKESGSPPKTIADQDLSRTVHLLCSVMIGPVCLP